MRSNVLPLERSEKILLPFDSRQLALYSFPFESGLDEFCVPDVVFKVQNSERKIHLLPFFDTAGRRLVDHRPKHAQLLHRVDELVEINRFNDIRRSPLTCSFSPGRALRGKR